MPRDRSRDPRRSPDSGKRRLLLGFLIGGIVMFIVLTPGIVQTTTSVIGLNQPDAETKQGANRSSTAYYLRAQDAAYLNRIFSERSHEIAYCGIITQAEHRWIRPWLADTVTATDSEVEFSTSNCPTRPNNVLMHTHPSGTHGLSETDRSQLMLSSVDAMCIQTGEVTTTPTDVASELTCFQDDRLNGETQISETPVVIRTRDRDSAV